MSDRLRLAANEPRCGFYVNGVRCKLHVDHRGPCEPAALADSADAPDPIPGYAGREKRIGTADAPPEPTEEMVAVRELFQEWLGATATFRNDELVSGVTKRTRRLLSVPTEQNDG